MVTGKVTRKTVTFPGINFKTCKNRNTMANNFKRDGDCVKVVLTSGQTGYAAGEGYKIGSQVGVILSITRDGQTVFTNQASAEGDVAVVALEGVFTLPKATGALTQGQKLYWDNTEGELTGTGTGNTFIGFADVAAASDDATADVRLWQSDASGAAVAANVAALAGTLTGTVDGTIADVAAIALSTSNTYTDAAVNSAVNTAITSINLQLKELQTTLNAEIAAIKAAGLQATS